MDEKINAMQRTLRVLEFICRQKHGVRVAELARAFGMSSPAIYKYLTSLASEGYIFKDEHAGRFRATYRVVEVAGHVQHNNDITEMTYPRLVALSNELESSVHLAIREGDLGVCVSKVENSSAIPSITRVGMSFDLYPTALGKALLAFDSPDARLEYLQRIDLVPYTDQTIRDRAALEDDLAATVSRGYSRDDEEHRQGLHAIGVPVFDYTGRVVASISTMIPASISPSQLEHVVTALQTGASDMSHLLGGASGAGHSNTSQEKPQ